MKPTAAKVMTFFISILLLITPVITSAQDEMPNVSVMWVMTIKAGHQAEFEAAMKDHVALRSQHEDPLFWEVYTPVTGEQVATTYGVRGCCTTWAGMDKNEVWTSENPQVMEHWFSQAHQHVESYAHYIDIMDMAHSHWPEDTVTNYVGVTEFHVAPGKGPAFAAARDKLSQIALNQGWAEDHRWGWYESIGGKGAIGLAIPHENYASMGAEDRSFSDFLAEHMGAEAAGELMNEFSSSIKGSHYNIWALDPNLSMSRN